MTDSSSSARVARSLRLAATRSRRTVHRAATAGLTAAFLLSIVGPAAVLASPIVAEGFDDVYAVAKNVQLIESSDTGVLANDTGGYANLVSAPDHGFLNLATNGSFTYDPNQDFVGADTFTYQACLNASVCDLTAATVTITVSNTAPVAVADPVTVLEDSSANVIDAMANDTDTNGDALHFAAIHQPSNGLVTVVGPGSAATLRYTPTANFHGTDTFTYSVSDSNLNSPLGTVTVTVGNVNDAPSFSAGEDVIVLEDADAYSATWATSISDGPGDTDEVSFVVTNDQNGLFATQPAISASGVLSFLLAANASGVATVDATIHDDGGTTNGGVASGTSLSFTITATAQNDGPSCGTDTVLLDEDETASGDLSLLCTDIDSNLTYTLLDVTGDGDVTVDSDGSWVYTPPENTSGSDSFQFRATDGSVPYDGSVSLTIAPINDGPTFSLAEEDVSVGEDAEAQTVSDFLTGASAGPDDESSQILSIDVTNDANELFLVQPTISLETGDLQYTPAADAHGSALVSVTVSDDGPASEPDEASDTRTFTITVDSINDAPVGVADVYGVDEDGVLTVVAAGTVSILGIGIEAPDGVLANDTDVDEDALSVVGNTEAGHGTVGTVDADGSFTYTPDPDYSGSDSFTYTITDGTLMQGLPVASDPITVTIVVEPINDAPVGIVHSYNVAEDGLLSVSAPGLLVGSSDLEDGTIVVLDYTYPDHGDFDSLEPDGQFAYSPDPDFHGTDTFEYWTWDGTAESEHYLVTITVTSVDDPVTAVADSKDVIEDTATTLDVLDNDTDPDHEAIRVSSVGSASHGELTIPVGGHNVRYTPDADYYGTDSFSYSATDDHGSTTSATVTVTVLAVNDAPTFTLSGDQVTAEDSTAQTVYDFMDPSSVGPANESSQTLSVDVTNEGNGFFSVQPWIEASTGTLQYTVAANAYGTVTVTVTATDTGGTANGGADTTDKAFTITIDPINDAPTFTLIGNQDTDEDSAAQNVTDFMYPSSVGPGEGSPETMSLDVTNDDNDLFAVQPTISLLTGTLQYTVAENANGVATVTVTATDTGGTANDGDDSTTDTFTITIDPINDAPIGVADAYTVAEDGVLSVATTYGFTILDSDAPAVVLANDSDVDLDALTVASNTEAEHGTVGTVAEDGSFTYTPDADFNGVDGFTYTVTDGTATSEAVTVSITVDAVNDAPVGVADAYSVDEDTVLAVLAADGLVDNDTDVDLDTLTVASNTEAEHGTVETVAEDGSFSYTPDADFHGEDTFTYTMTDGIATSDAVTVTITVDSINDAPVGVANAYDVNEDAVLTVLAVDGLVANDTDADLDTLTVVSKTAASHGTVGTVPANGSFTYTPAANFNGTDTFTYTMTDGTTTSGSITVTITVNAVNDAPVGVANRFFATEDVVLTVLALNGPLANDTDIDLDTLTVVSQSAAGHGTVSTIAADGSFTYTPDANFNGTDNFIYRINDGTVTSGPIAIQVVTSAVNDAPNAVNDTGSVAENGPATSYNVLTNDTDVEGNALLLTHVSVSSTAGTVAIVGGQARFTPHLLFWGTAVISYTVSDQHGGTDVGTLTVSVSRDVVAPVATTPVVTIDSGSIVSRVPIAVAWSATDVGVGVTQFQVQISTDGLAFTSLYTGTATTTTTSLLGGHAYRFRVRAVDAEGNVGGYQTTVSSLLAVAFWSNSGVTYRVGAWDTFSPTGAHAYAYSSNLNDSASYTFTGSEIVWVGPKSARSGTANVYIDGVKVSTVSLYRASGLSGQQLFKRTFSSSGVHTIKIVVAQAGKWVSLDEFVVLR